MIFYVLVDQGRATLNKNLVEAIANEWIKNGVKTPQKALEFVRERQAKKQKQATKSYGRRKPVVQRETLPDWAKKILQLQLTMLMILKRCRLLQKLMQN